jgi:hypothetical protein
MMMGIDQLSPLSARRARRQKVHCPECAGADEKMTPRYLARAVQAMPAALGAATILRWMSERGFLPHFILLAGNQVDVAVSDQGRGPRPPRGRVEEIDRGVPQLMPT